MSESVIAFDGVWKKFRRGEHHDSLRDLIPELMNPAQVSKVDLKLKLAEKRTCTPPDHVACEICTAGEHPRRPLRELRGEAHGGVDGHARERPEAGDQHRRARVRVARIR